MKSKNQIKIQILTEMIEAIDRTVNQPKAWQLATLKRRQEYVKRLQLQKAKIKTI